MDAMDCGPASLCMIAKYYGKSYSLETLRQKTFINRDGVSLLGISIAAEEMGFRTRGGFIEFHELIENALLPCIIYWEQEHFVVVYETKKNKNDYKIYVADPSKGKVIYTKSDFCKHWLAQSPEGQEAGIALLLEPTDLFYNKIDCKNKHIKLNFITRYFIQYKKYFYQIIIGLFIGSLIQLILPFLTQAIVDIGIAEREINFIWLIVLSQMALLFGQMSMSIIRKRLILHISTRINISLISDFFIKLMRLPMQFFDTKLSGDLFQRIDDHKRIESFLTTQTLNILFSIFAFIVFGVVLFIYNTYIFLVFIGGSMLSGLWSVSFLDKRRILDYENFGLQGKNRNQIYQIVEGIQEIKLQKCEQRKRWEWEDTQAEIFKINLRSLSIQQNHETGLFFINGMVNILITVLSATSVINGGITLGMMIAIQYIIGQLSNPIEQLVNFIYQWQDVSISIGRMREIHTLDNEEVNTNTNVLTKSSHSIEFRNVSFKYDYLSPNYILNDINILIPKGKVTAIVGASGSGKTTLIKLLLGFYLPNDGKIYIGKDELNNINLSNWRSLCGVVMQDGYLFSDSIAKNIAIMDEKIDLNRLKHAAAIANIENFINQLPLGYNTIIGQDGQSISQGQRQRILIARVVYKNPEFIFLDEATNSLDVNNEKVIVENLQTFYKNKTVVIVAHRLTTVKNADKIIVLNNGSIAEQGNHESLIQSKGKYYELVKNQLELGN